MMRRVLMSGATASSGRGPTSSMQAMRNYCVGQNLNKTELLRLRTTEHANKSMQEIFGDDKVVVFGLVGAFTSTCQNNSMASIVSNLDALKAAGASRVLVTSVNDPFVLAAFAKPYATHAPFLQFLADSDAEFAIAINAAIDLSVAGLGLRSNRYALVVNKGVIEHQLVEEKPAQLVVTDAKNVVPLLSQSLQATYEAKVAQALAAGLFPQVVFNANRMVVKGLRITPAIYAALVQAAAAVGRPNSARHFLAHWQNDASAKFSANDAANAEKWIAGASKKILYPDDPAIIAELEALAAKVPRLKLA